jgi:hypothetical protein
VAKAAVRFHPRAAEEAANAHLWYQARSPHVGETFRADLDAAIAAIADTRRLWLRLFVRFRRLPMRRFPFSVVYLDRGETRDVIALAHHRRRPGFWSRVPSQPTHLRPPRRPNSRAQSEGSVSDPQ